MCLHGSFIFTTANGQMNYQFPDSLFVANVSHAKCTFRHHGAWTIRPKHKSTLVSRRRTRRPKKKKMPRVNTLFKKVKPRVILDWPHRGFFFFFFFLPHRAFHYGLVQTSFSVYISPTL